MKYMLADVQDAAKFVLSIHLDIHTVFLDDSFFLILIRTLIVLCILINNHILYSNLSPIYKVKLFIQTTHVRSTLSTSLPTNV
jgi:hypothetical protein